jgi:hypothetical protein
MVPTTAVVVAMAWQEPEASVSATVSSGSKEVSALGSTETVAVAEPAAKVMDLVAGEEAIPM